MLILRCTLVQVCITMSKFPPITTFYMYVFSLVFLKLKTHVQSLQFTPSRLLIYLFGLFWISIIWLKDTWLIPVTYFALLFHFLYL